MRISGEGRERESYSDGGKRGGAGGRERVKGVGRREGGGRGRGRGGE